jgi:hypothetical protein
VATLPDGAIAPGSGSVVTASNYQFINEYLSKLIAQPDATPGDQLREAMAFLKQGYYSDGTRQGEIGRYASGHDRHRLQVFLAGDQLVGSDEQYAATLGLVAAQLGFPSRVVFGANVPAGGVIKGSDVTAWVEVELSDGQWYTIAPSTFIPDRERRPNQIPPPQYQDARAKVVPPPNPVRPPGSLDSWLEADNANSDSGFFGQFWRILLAILRWVGPPALVIGAIVGALLGAKALRRRRRRRHGAFTTRVAAGWREALDRTRDLGVSVPVEATRQEQVLVIGRGELQPLADDADRLIFGPGDPDEEAVGGYWEQVDQLRRDSVAGLPWWRRWLVALNPLSLLPGRVSQRVGAISVSNLPWRRLGAA